MLRERLALTNEPGSRFSDAPLHRTAALPTPDFIRHVVGQTGSNVTTSLVNANNVKFFPPLRYPVGKATVYLEF